MNMRIGQRKPLFAYPFPREIEAVGNWQVIPFIVFLGSKNLDDFVIVNLPANVVGFEGGLGE